MEFLVDTKASSCKHILDEGHVVVDSKEVKQASKNK